jgi:hypothetical protein
VHQQPEAAAERDRRHCQRELFDGAARLYQATRPGYPLGPATALSWPDDVRRGFTEELRRHLAGCDEVRLTLEASVTMARAGARAVAS